MPPVNPLITPHTPKITGTNDHSCMLSLITPHAQEINGTGMSRLTPHSLVHLPPWYQPSPHGHIPVQALRPHGHIYIGTNAHTSWALTGTSSHTYWYKIPHLMGTHWYIQGHTSGAYIPIQALSPDSTSSHTSWAHTGTGTSAQTSGSYTGTSAHTGTSALTSGAHTGTSAHTSRAYTAAYRNQRQFTNNTIVSNACYCIQGFTHRQIYIIYVHVCIIKWVSEYIQSNISTYK